MMPPKTSRTETTKIADLGREGRAWPSPPRDASRQLSETTTHIGASHDEPGLRGPARLLRRRSSRPSDRLKTQTPQRT
jgi:hypothetical protein